MKKLKYILILILQIISLNAGIFDFLPFGHKMKSDERLIITPGIQEKQHYLNILKKEKEILEKSEKEFNDNIQTELNITNKKIEEVKQKLKENNNEFLNKILAKLNEISQLLIDIQLKRKNILNAVNQHIELIENYLKDPTFKSKSIEVKASYSFESLENLQKDILNYEQELNCLNDQKINNESLLETLKKDLITVDKDLKNKEKDQKKFSAKIKEAESKQEKNNLTQKGELLDLDIQALSVEKRLIDLKLKDEQQKLNLLNTRIYFSDSIYKILKNNLFAVEQSLWVSDLDVETASKLVANKSRESSELQAKYSEEIRRYSQEKEKIKQELEKSIKKNKITDLKVLTELNFDPKKVENEPIFYQLAFLNNKIITLEKNIELKEAQRDYEKEKIKIEEILLNILTFWNKISQKKFKTEEEIESEKKKYESIKEELSKALSTYKEKILSLNNSINQNKSQINISQKIKSLNERTEKYISHYGKEQFRNSFNFINKSSEQIKSQIELNNKIVETYNNTIAIIKETLQKVNIILLKVENIGGILIRSKYAISWDNLKNILPDIKLYFSHLVKVTALFSLSNVKYALANVAKNSNNFAYVANFIINLFLLLLIFFVLRRILPFISALLLSTRPAFPILYFINCWFAVIINFISLNFLSIFIWSVVFLATKTGIITNLNFKAIFYLFSIFYLIFLSNKFIRYVLSFNKKNNYLLINPNFQHRFISVFTFFIYSTIIIFFFIESFISLTYGKFELPTILLAIYSIIFRASLIFLIGKDEVLNLIPEKPGIWHWIRDLISKFYYLFLVGIISIMIISDPYIGGFSKLVSFILWGIIFTILLITGLWWLQIIIRKISSIVFFKAEEEDESTKERFAYAKTFYGFFSVISFLFFILLALFIGAKIWGIPISFEKITEYLNLTIFSVKGEADQFIPINLKSFITLFGFLFFGFVVAWAFDRFILRRIFNILLVDQGVQNTISSVTYYLIIIVILLVGLLRIGLSGMIPFLVGALAVGLAFAIKGPANDIIGYFILVIERSVKIGDYIEINEETRGIVRKITPRSVILRRRNSNSVIIPNSHLTNTVFFNWNYTPGYIAFNDIFLTVPFTADPEVVHSILQKVLSQDPNVLKSPTPVVWLNDFSENGYVFLVRGFLSSINVMNQWEIASNVRIAIVKELKKEGIQIAAATRIVVSSQEMIKEKVNF